ncbi:MFS transporter [Methylobacterium pseudosasicola]|uniref:Predicted arabinose efflux permease, MFS family n=1 Tax=Methylobacterium pseudosasicola TaxID=582667 RepID=A0A1I4LQS5_9HYPH|nr:MFS transporter [Methylobacterium pseudosasicola]SFL93163.1 Predicted arabinose efflux permease, MFS family [Methylobacterium pseudosasicola]
MTTSVPADAMAAPEPARLSRGLTLLFSVAAGVIVLSLYASQPLAGIIGPSLGLGTTETGLVTTITLLGYAGGLFLVVPLTDLVENRALITRTLGAAVIALAGAAAAPSAPLFLVASFLVGVTASAIQMLVPTAAALAPVTERGRVVGTVMSGLMLGILLSRPAASLVAEYAGWRWFYGILAALVALLTIVLGQVVPERRPAQVASYPRLIASLLALLRREPVLRRRAASQGLCMGAFGVFWTSVALRLAEPPFNLSQTGIALFALAGAAGAVVAPVAGRAGDRGLTRPATILAHLAILGAMALAACGGAEPTAIMPAPLALGAMVLAAVLLDLGVIGDQTLGRRAINMLQPEARGRLNGLFTGLFFLGAALGSGLSGLAWVQAGWAGVCAVGALFGAAALVLSLSDRHPSA